MTPKKLVRLMWRYVALACVSAAWVACSRSGAQVAALVLGQSQEPPSLNQLFLQGLSASEIGPLVYSYLLTVDDRGNLTPDIATNVPSLANGGISRDGLTVTYKLRRDVKWQDGAPLTADDVVFTYLAIMNPNNNVPSRAGYDRIASVSALDRYTIRLRLRQPYSPILSYFMAPGQNFTILPSHLLKRYHDLNTVPFNAAPIGSGPYRVAQWVRGDHLRFVRNLNYFRGPPKIAGITIKFIPESATILSQLRTGEVNAYFVADQSYLREYPTIRSSRVIRALLSGTVMLLFNLQAADIRDLRVRRAIAEAVDFPRIVRKVTQGAQTTIAGDRGLFSWAYDPRFSPPAYDTAAANRDFDAAGWRRSSGGTRTKEGRELSLQVDIPSGAPVATALGVDFQQELRAVGVHSSIRTFTPNQFMAPAKSGGPLFGGTFQLAYISILASGDPDTHWFLGCNQIPPSGFNFSRFCDAASDRAQTAGIASYDRAVRRKYSALVQQRVAQEVPFVPMWQINAIYVCPSSMRGLRPSAYSAFWNAGQWTLSN